MKKSIVVLGGNKLHRGFEGLRNKMEIDQIIVIDWNENPEYIGDVHYKEDIKNYEGIKNLPIDWTDVVFVYTSADIAVKTQKQLHEDLGYKVPSDDAIENALIKGRSKDCWLKSNILNKYSIVVSDRSDLIIDNTKAYIFKPNCSSGSRNITILRHRELTDENIDKAIEYAKSVSIDNKCIVEEFVVGTEYTVDMLGDNFGHVGVYGISKKYHTPFNTENKIATKLHYAPSDVSRSDLKKIEKFGIECYKSIGLSNSFGHLEVIVTESGKVVPIEIGARSSGFIATTLIDEINNVCYLKEYSRVLHGESISDGLQFDGKKSSMYYFYDVRPGTSRCTTNIMKYLPSGVVSHAYDRSALLPNKKFSVINADHERYGYEVISGNSKVLNIDTVTKAECAFNDEFIGE